MNLSALKTKPRILTVSVCKLNKFALKNEIFVSCIVNNTMIATLNKDISLILLIKNALKAAFTVPILVFQKLIKKNDVNPINSQPKYNTKKLPPETNNIILPTNVLIKSNNLSTFGSYLK